MMTSINTKILVSDSDKHELYQYIILDIVLHYVKPSYSREGQPNQK